MAKSGDSGGWSDLLRDLVRNFLLLRDLFGYMLPGGVFLLIGVLTERIPLRDLLDCYHPPVWAASLLLAAVAYAAGHVLAAIFYLHSDIVHGPSKIEFKEVYYRAYFPELYIEYDRRETLSLLRAALAMAFVFGAIVFRPAGPKLLLLLIAGVVMTFNAAHAGRHLQLVHEATLQAGDKAAEEHKDSSSPAGV